MTPEQLQALQYLASLPLQAILLIAVVNLWKAYNTAQNARVEDLRQNYEKNLADLRTRVILLEDRLGIPIQNAPKTNDNGLKPNFANKDPKLD